MGKVLFITGATGFIGRRVLDELRDAPFERIYCLTRSDHTSNGRVQYIQGDLLHPPSYLWALAESDVVLHLAAATGRARPDEYRRVNIEAVQVLVEACRKCHVARLIHVSTIAATYRKHAAHYHYALSKRQGEEVVAASGLNYTIVRPTIILDPNGPAFQGLSKLALGPCVVVIGDGKARVQPLTLDDVARRLAAITCEDQSQTPVIDLGGPKILTIEQLLLRIRKESGKTAAPVVRVPVSLLMPVLALMEKFLLPVMPVTAGQLSPLLNDAIAGRCPTVPGSVTLEEEVSTFARYLMKRDPSEYVLEKYVDYHRQTNQAGECGFDRLLVSIARRHPLLTMLCESYANWFFRGAVLRKKLVLVLALLECTREGEEHLQTTELRESMAMLYSRLAVRIGGHLACAVIGALLLSPVRAVCALGSAPSRAS